MSAQTGTVPNRGDWILLGPHGQQSWWRVEHAPRHCARCPAGWWHLWCRPWQGNRLGPVRFIVTPLDGLVARHPGLPTSRR